MFLGGSTMLGSAISPNNETIPGFFDQKIKNDFENVEIINAGVSGADSTNEWYYLKNYLLEYEPDMIVMYDGWNNVMNRNDPKTDITLEMLSSYTYHNLKNTESNFIREIKDTVLKWDIHILKHFGLLLMEQKILNADSRLSAQSELNDDIQKVHSILNRDWNALCELGIEKDFTSIFYIQPTLGTSQRTIHEIEKSYLNDEIVIRDLEIIKKISLEEIDIFNCPNMYDLRNTFEQYDNQEIFDDAGHTNSVGNKIIAEKMYEEIKNVIKDENN
jgi:lysophospholipase L1-like esterase